MAQLNWTETFLNSWGERSREEWKYTRPSFIEKNQWGPAPAVGDQQLIVFLQQEVQKNKLPHSEAIILLNGHWARSPTSSVQMSESRFQIQCEKQDWIAYASEMGASSAYEIVISSDTTLEIFLYPHFLKEDSARAIFNKLRIRVLENVKATVLVRPMGSTQQGLSFHFMQVVVEKNSHLTLLNTVIELLGVSYFEQIRIEQKENSHVQCFSINCHAPFVRQELKVSLSENHAKVETYGCDVSASHDLIDHHTLIEHQVANTLSRQLYKGILLDQSRMVFNGKIHIHAGANGSDSSQLAKHLLLSNEAEVDAKPELTVVADDVKATHGAAIGAIQPEEIFYLKSRGIPQEKAMQMLALGFVSEGLLNLSDLPLQKVLVQFLSESLEAKVLL